MTAQLVRRTDEMRLHPTKTVLIGMTAGTALGMGQVAALYGIPVERVAVELDGEYYRLVISRALPPNTMYLLDLELFAQEAPVDTPRATVFE